MKCIRIFTWNHSTFDENILDQCVFLEVKFVTKPPNFRNPASYTMSEEWGYHRHYEEWEGAEKAKGKRKGEDDGAGKKKAPLCRMIDLALL